MNISLCCFVKNEAHCIHYMIKSVIDYVDEFIVVDTGSEDNTIEICKIYGARVYKVGFTDFGSIRTLTAHLATKEWVLMLDADEILEKPNKLEDLVVNGDSFAYAFPRKRWLDLSMKNQTELEAYPDWQVRLFKNNKNYIWQRELHENFVGTDIKNIENGPMIHHFQDVLRDEKRKQERKELYEKLAKIAKVTAEGGKCLVE